MRLSDDLRTLGSWSKIDGAHCVPLCGMAMFSVLGHCDRPQVQIKGKICSRTYRDGVEKGGLALPNIEISCGTRRPLVRLGQD